MVGILGSTTIISEYREFRFRKAKQKKDQNIPLNETTHLLTPPTREEKQLTEDAFEEEPLSLYDCSLETYNETSLPWIEQECY